MNNTSQENQIFSIEQVQGGYIVVRGKMPLRTPAGNPLVVPTRRLAESIAYEWEDQGKKVHKVLLKLTPIACVAIDLSFQNREALLADIVPYIETDLVCYRTEAPELNKEQILIWDPLIEWVKERYGIALRTTTGLSIKQDDRNIELLRDILNGFDAWRLAAFAVVIKPLGSAVLALALLDKKINYDQAFYASNIEEYHQAKCWGYVPEREVVLHAKRQDVMEVSLFLRAL